MRALVTIIIMGIVAGPLGACAYRNDFTPSGPLTTGVATIYKRPL